MISRVKQTGFVRVMSLLGRRGWPYALGILTWGVVLAFCFNLVMAFVFKDVLNAALEGDRTLLLRGVVLALGTFILGMPIATLGRYALTMATLRTLTAIRTNLFRAISHLPMCRLEARHSGDLISRATNDVQTIEVMLLRVMSSFAQAIAQGSIGMTAIFVLEWRLGLVTLAVGLTSFGIGARFAKTLSRRSDQMQSSISTMTERLSDLLAGIRVARMFRLEGEVQSRYASSAEEAARKIIAHARSQAVFDAVQVFIGWFQSFGTLALGLYLFSQGHLLVGAVWAIVHIQGNASFLFDYLGRFLTSIQRGLAGGRRILEVLDLPLESVGDGAGTSGEASVALRDVSFSYEDAGDRSALRSVFASARPGEVVALVGPSGSGKSTLLKLLLGFYDADAGEVRIGSLPLSADTLPEAREQMAYVPQDAYLFSGTIRENIGYGRPGATEEEIIEAAKAANAHGFILEQPDGYETDVGEGGAHLSGGQRQRIAIARALLRDAPILLLDEATSALDSESERLVQEALDVLMEGRTTIAVAHRLSTIEHADRIYVLDEGRIVEEGRHADLHAASGLYRRLHDLQFAAPQPVA
jgi:ATP-binding cassette subfamily B protein